MNKLTNEEQNKELLKLVKEYPTLPVVFFCSSEDVCDDYSYTFMKFRRVEKGVIYESDINDIIYTSEDDYVEDLCDYFADDVRFNSILLILGYIIFPIRINLFIVIKNYKKEKRLNNANITNKKEMV